MDTENQIEIGEQVVIIPKVLFGYGKEERSLSDDNLYTINGLRPGVVVGTTVEDGVLKYEVAMREWDMTAECFLPSLGNTIIVDAGKQIVEHKYFDLTKA